MGQGAAGRMEGLGCHQDHDVQTETWIKQPWVIKTAQTRHRNRAPLRSTDRQGDTDTWTNQKEN